MKECDRSCRAIALGRDGSLRTRAIRVITLAASLGSRWYCSSQFFKIETAGKKSYPCVIIRSMLLSSFFPQLKQCARLIRGLTIALSSPQAGH